MTQIYITIGIISLVALLICYIFIRQTVSQRKQEKERLSRVLAKRANELLQMLSVYPDNFLPSEIVVFVYQCIIEMHEKLCRLQPTNTDYITALKTHKMQLEVIIRNPASGSSPELQNLSQINEIKPYIKLLVGFLQTSCKNNRITKKQYEHYHSLLKALMIKLSVNGSHLTASQALNEGKIKNAIHQYHLAKQLLERETPANYQEQIQKIDHILGPLQEQEQREQEDKIREENSQKPEAEADWKKKNVYD